jgi:spore coat protein SA
MGFPNHFKPFQEEEEGQKRLRICMIGKETTSIPPPPGKKAAAPQRWIWEVSKRLSKKHEVTICSPSDRASFRIQNGIRCIYIKRKQIRISRAPAIFSYTKKVFNYYLKALANIRDLNPDIVHLHSTAPHTIVLSKNLLKNACSLISVHQCIGFRTLSFPAKRIEDELISYSFGKADAILPVSKYAKEHLRTSFQRLNHKSFCVTYCGVDSSLFRFDQKMAKNARDKYGLSDSQAILFVGRIVPEKGPHLLLEALKIVRKKIPNAKLLLVGPVQTTRNVSYALNIIKACKKEAKFLGPLPYEELIPLYCAADIFVNPVLVPEAFGMVNVEAMACERPVIATQVGAIPEIIDNGKNGILIPPHNVKALASAIIFLLDNHNIAKQMGTAGRDKVEKHFTWEKVVKRVTKAYETCLEK